MAFEHHVDVAADAASTQFAAHADTRLIPNGSPPAFGASGSPDSATAFGQMVGGWVAVSAAD
ncbi:hypothetical protein [Micromonospora sp. NPDC048830]|uniref:hypothetical protein n=1 Tax=Micromonospora sp. NPDC048830 TaxID=3364257 RepID=UPI0037226472